MQILYRIFCILIGYFVGGINPAYIIGKLRGIDIRSRGSGNAGASNATVVMGRKVGIFSAFFDIAKAFFAVLICSFLFPALQTAGVFGGCACILGHIFPLFMRFRGGKGLACLGGAALALDWKVFLVLISLEIILVLIADYICIVPITGSVLFTAVYAWRTGSIEGTLALVAVTVVILCKHRINLCRIRAGEEVHFSYLWKKKK